VYTTCKPFSDTSGFSSFGKFDIGAVITDIPQKGRKPNCVVYNNGAADCEFVDERGVSYLVDGRVVVRKEIVDATTYKGTLPLGMRRGETLSDLLHRSPSFPKEFPKLNVTQSTHGTLVSTGACIITRTKAEIGLELNFDSRGQLLRVLAGSIPN
jgi:hypothetical protein